MYSWVPVHDIGIFSTVVMSAYFLSIPYVYSNNRKHPNSLQISPPSSITFPESFLTHLMCVWCMHVSVQVHAPMCAHVSVRALPLPLSPPLLPSDGVSLPQPETPCFPPADWSGKCWDLPVSFQGYRLTQLCLAFSVGFKSGLCACRADILTTETSPQLHQLIPLHFFIVWYHV